MPVPAGMHRKISIVFSQSKKNPREVRGGFFLFS